MQILEIQNLTKAFSVGWFSKQRNVALEAVNLQVNEGEVLFVTGPNGGGKTTLLKIISTLILPDQGSVRVAGFDVVDSPAMVRSQISLVTNEDRSFFWRITCFENLRFFCILNNLAENVLRERIENISRCLGLSSIMEKRFDQCSTGMKRRLAIARGLLNQPRLLLLDEPTSSLDEESGHAMRRLVSEQVERHGLSVIYVTHQKREMMLMDGRLAVMTAGDLQPVDKKVYLDEREGK